MESQLPMKCKYCNTKKEEDWCKRCGCKSFMADESSNGELEIKKVEEEKPKLPSKTPPPFRRATFVESSVYEEGDEKKQRRKINFSKLNKETEVKKNMIIKKSPKRETEEPSDQMERSTQPIEVVEKEGETKKEVKVSLKRGSEKSGLLKRTLSGTARHGKTLLDAWVEKEQIAVSNFGDWHDQEQFVSVKENSTNDQSTASKTKARRDSTVLGLNEKFFKIDVELPTGEFKTFIAPLRYTIDQVKVTFIHVKFLPKRK